MSPTRDAATRQQSPLVHGEDWREPIICRFIVRDNSHFSVPIEPLGFGPVSIGKAFPFVNGPDTFAENGKKASLRYYSE